MKIPIGSQRLAWCYAVWAAVAIGAAPNGAAERKPNVLIVLADQWRAQAFGFAGDTNIKTPNLDRMASGGVRFTHAISGLPVCCPARASLLTGQRPLTHGVFLNDVPLRMDATTLAESMKSAGYDTGYIGKWHLNAHDRSSFIPRDRRQGFDYWKVLECTHDYSNSVYYADAPEKLIWDGYDAFAQTRDACDFVRARQKSEKPFLLVLAWGPPHDPYFTAPTEYRALYTPEALQLRPNVPAGLEARARTILAGYYAHGTALDECVGRLIEILKRTGVGDNTILVFTSDHGDMLGSQGMLKKQKPFDESIRVPLLIRWPKGLGTRERTLDALFNSEDLMPTLLGLCGVPVPAGVDGLDYSGYIRGGQDPGDGSKVILSVAPFGEWERRAGGREYRGIRTVRHTYVCDLDGPWLLFDNETDPYQTNNLVNVPAHAKLQDELGTRLQTKLRAQGDTFLPAADYIRQWGYEVDPNGTVPF